MEEISKNLYFEKSLAVIYLNKTASMSVTAVRGGSDLEHAAWMCTQVIENISDSKKANRWIGWVQCVMHMSQAFTIDEMRNHVIELKQQK